MAEGTDDGAGEPGPRVRSPVELFFLGALSCILLLGGVLCLLRIADGQFIAPQGPAVLFGLGAAILVYAFLDGKGDKAEFRHFRFGGAAAVLVVIAFFTNAGVERHITKVMNDRAEQREAAKRAQDDEDRKSRSLFLLDHREEKQVPGGGSVTLVEITSSKGSLQKLNALGEEADPTLAGLVRIAGVSGPGMPVSSLTEARWQNWHRTLEPKDQIEVDGTPYATILARSSNNRETRKKIYLRGEEIRVGGDQRPEAVICVRRLLNVRESESGEKEVAVLSHGPCRN